MRDENVFRSSSGKESADLQTLKRPGKRKFEVVLPFSPFSPSPAKTPPWMDAVVDAEWTVLESSVLSDLDRSVDPVQEFMLGHRVMSTR